MDADTLDLLRESLRHLLTEDAAAPLSTRLAELGWDDVLADDAPTALRTLFDVKGATLSSADALGAELARTLAKTTGDAVLGDAAVAIPGPDGPARWDNALQRIHIDVLLTAPLAERRLVIEVGGDAPSVLVVTNEAHTLQATTVEAEDPWLGLVRLTGSLPSSSLTWLDPTTAEAAKNEIVGTARRLLAAELVAVGAHMVRIAVAYTKDRVQYGKPIGVFQALQHRLASAHSLVVGATGLVEDASDTGDAWTSTLAKCLAGRAAEHASQQAQQCFGAIGFTWEHELHRSIKRAYVLDALFGDWRTLEAEIGTTILRTRNVPMLGFL